MWDKQALKDNTQKLEDNAKLFQKNAKMLKEETRKAMGYSTRAKIIIGTGLGVGVMAIYHYLL